MLVKTFFQNFTAVEDCGQRNTLALASSLQSLQGLLDRENLSKAPGDPCTEAGAGWRGADRPDPSDWITPWQDILRVNSKRGPSRLIRAIL